MAQKNSGCGCGCSFWLLMLVLLLLLGMCSGNKRDSGCSPRWTNYGTSVSRTSDSTTAQKTLATNYEDAKIQYDRDVSSYGDNEYKEAYAAALLGLQKLEKKLLDAKSKDRVTSASIDEARAAVEVARTDYVNEGRRIQKEQADKEADRRRQQEEQRRIEAERTRQERIASIEASYVEPEAFHMSFSDAMSYGDMSIALTQQVTEDIRTYKWDESFQTYFDCDLERITIGTAYLEEKATADEVYAAIERMAEARRTMVIQQEILYGGA